MTDTEIIAAIQAGGNRQEACMHHLFDAHRGLVGRGINRYKLSEEEAVDAFSDTLLAIRKQILNGKFRGESKLSTYLFSIFGRKCVDSIRKKATNRVTTMPEYEDTEDFSQDLESQVITRESFEAVMGWMNQLGEVCREILMLRYFYGYEDMEEIAQKVGVKNGNTAGSLRYRCMKQLMKLVKPNA